MGSPTYLLSTPREEARPARLHAKDLPEPVQRSRVLRLAHSIEIHELPPDDRQIGDAGQVDAALYLE